MTLTMRSGGHDPSPRRRVSSRGPNTAHLDEKSVRSAYRRWAPFYDNTFGRFTTEGRRHAVEIINQRSGRVLEVGVGTGLSLPNYGTHLEIVGIDLSPEMLEKAREKVTEDGLENVTGLHEMDAAELTFQDTSFDTGVAMYTLTVEAKRCARGSPPM